MTNLVLSFVPQFMRTLNVSSNYMRKLIFPQSVNLTRLDVSNNQLYMCMGQFDPLLFIKSLTKLEYLSMNRNSYGLSVRCLMHKNIGLPNLKVLTGNHNKLTTVFFVSKMPLLEELDLSYNKISDVKDIFVNLSKLVFLDMAGNLLTDIPLLHPKSKIRVLKLAKNATYLTGLIHLVKIELSKNPLQCNCDLLPFRKWIQRPECISPTFPNLATICVRKQNHYCISN